ncbi:MAG: hypothetical protein MZV70_76090 [Desulfobacterales bacterium]|nr:hypothetical protein [Desulfobacterales bacterium]
MNNVTARQAGIAVGEFERPARGRSLHPRRASAGSSSRYRPIPFSRPTPAPPRGSTRRCSPTPG